MITRLIGLIVAGAVVTLLASGCAGSLQDVKVEKVLMCEKGSCATLGKDVAVDDFLTRFYALLNSNIDRDAKLSEVDPVSREETHEAISYFTQGGPLPFYSSIYSYKFTDVSYLDREKREIHFKLRPWASFLGVPILCAEGDGNIKVVNPQDVQLEASSLCTWLVNPVNWQLRLKLDFVDLDRGAIGGHYSTGHGGPTSAGRGSGYQVATFKKSYVLDAGSPALANPNLKPVLSPSKSLEQAGHVGAQSQLSFTTTLTDTNKDGVLDEGEKVSLTVEVVNQGDFASRDADIILSGTPYLVNLLGSRRAIGSLGPNGRHKETFETTLPPHLTDDSPTELKVEVREAGMPAQEVRTLRLAVRPQKHTETVQVLSQSPRLKFTLELKDQNNNRVLEGGEEIALLAEVGNSGEATAEDVHLQLSGSPTLVKLFGADQPVGNLPPGSRKRVEMRGVLPTQIVSESAELRVELSEKRGFAPAESRLLRVATKGQEQHEVVEVISELSVDDIPPKILGNEHKDDYAVVVGISKYRESVIPEVKYARRDAEVLAKYFERLSGIPKDNIAILTDAHATKADIEAYLDDWLPRRVTPHSRVFFYYAGHGAPEPGGKGAYLVPYEGHPDFVSKMIPLPRLYDALNHLKAQEIVVFLDSCFSGAKGRSVMQQGIRPLVMTDERQLAVRDKPVVMAASSGSEVTSDLDNARHGLFTYYLLKGLRGEADKNGDKQVDLDELFSFVSAHVVFTASRELNRAQTPVLLPSGSGTRGRLELSRIP